MARKARKAKVPERKRQQSDAKAQPGKKTPKSKPLGTDFLDERLSKALAHWMRVNIMAVASWRKISPSEYARETGVGISRVSYHFKRLVEYGVIELVDTEQVRGSVKHFYRGYTTGDFRRRKLGRATEIRAGWRRRGSASRLYESGRPLHRERRVQRS
jgi:DNA-binding transcriptional ArsR family regulator